PLIRIVCRSLDCPYGAFWFVDTASKVLRLRDVWSEGESGFTAFEAASKSHEFARGIGFPGRVWASGKAEWITDVEQDRSFPRALDATVAGLHGALAIPIMSSGKF